MEVVCSSETWEDLCHTTRRHIPEESIVHRLHLENPSSHIPYKHALFSVINFSSPLSMFSQVLCSQNTAYSVAYQIFPGWKNQEPAFQCPCTSITSEISSHSVVHCCVEWGSAWLWNARFAPDRTVLMLLLWSVMAAAAVFVVAVNVKKRGRGDCQNSWHLVSERSLIFVFGLVSYVGGVAMYTTCVPYSWGLPSNDGNALDCVEPVVGS
jgi:hypothetical protein